MKLCLIHFESCKLKYSAKNNFLKKLLKIWLIFYNRSKTTIEPCLILDQYTKVPDFWPYEYKRGKEFPAADAMEKIGWLKSQAYNLVGPCIVIDSDAFILSSIDDLQSLKYKIGMCVFDQWDNAIKQSYWERLGPHFQTAVQVQNSEEIFELYKNKIKEKKQLILSSSPTKHLEDLLFPDFVFSEICWKIGDKLEEKYNRTYPRWDELEISKLLNSNNTKILHFPGHEKEKSISMFLKVHDLEF